MALTNNQKNDLNNMNVAAQNVSLGNIIDSIDSMFPSSGSYVAIFGSDTDYGSFEEDGTLSFSGSATTWSDIFFPLVTAKQGQTDQPLFSSTELGYLFPKNNTSHQMYIVAQFPHDMKVGSDLSPHVHWKQTQSGSVVYKMDYKWFSVGGQVPATWETHIMNSHVISYTSGSLNQITYGQKISGSVLDTSNYAVSSIMLIKLYRDDNDYDANAVTYQFDIHYEQDTIGSRTEFTK